jgi:hypothetical protein
VSGYSTSCIDIRADELLISADPDIVGLLSWRAPGSHAGMSPPVGQGLDRRARMGGGSAGGWCGGARKALGLRGTLRGRMVLGGADSGWPGLACASVFAGQGLYLGRGDRSAGHGKKKVYAAPSQQQNDQRAETLPAATSLLSRGELRDSGVEAAPQVFGQQRAGLLFVGRVRWQRPAQRRIQQRTVHVEGCLY